MSLRRAVCRTVHSFPNVQTRGAGLAKMSSPAAPARPLCPARSSPHGRRRRSVCGWRAAVRGFAHKEPICAAGSESFVSVEDAGSNGRRRKSLAPVSLSRHGRSCTRRRLPQCSLIFVWPLQALERSAKSLKGIEPPLRPRERASLCFPKWSWARGSNPHGCASAVLHRVSSTPSLTERNGTIRGPVSEGPPARRREGKLGYQIRRSAPAGETSPDPYISRPDIARNPFVLCVFSRVLPVPRTLPAGC